jgi:hypothetical protein
MHNMLVFSILTDFPGCSDGGASPHANPPLHMYIVYTNNAQYVSIFYIFTMTEIGNLNSILMYFDIFYSNRFMNLDAYLGVSLGNLNY